MKGFCVRGKLVGPGCVGIVDSHGTLPGHYGTHLGLSALGNELFLVSRGKPLWRLKSVKNKNPQKRSAPLFRGA